MTTSPASGSLTFRARRLPVWFCFGLSSFLLFMGIISAFAVSPVGTPNGHVGLAFLFLVIVGAPAVFIFKLGNDLRRSRIVLTDDGVDIRVNRFRIWAIRRLGSARLSWRDIYGVQMYEIPNFVAPTGGQVDYVLHTAQGLFAVSSIQFANAERIATLIAGHIGRKVDELPAGIAPVGASDPAGRRGIRLMRALGWIAQVAGILFPALMFGAWLQGSPLEPGTIGGVAATSGVLLMIGRSRRRFSLK
jgi:hypothetical protein